MINRYAVIHDGVVENVILAQPDFELPGRTLIDLADHDPKPGIGWSWDGESFFPPEPAPGPSAPWVKTKYQFRQLFTFAERVAIDNFDSNGSLDAPTKAQIRTMMKDLELSAQVEQANPELLPGLQLLEQAGLIGAGRAQQIHDGEPPPPPE